MADNIVLFSVSGTPIKISIEKLAVHPQSLLTEIVNKTVQPQDGFFIECCPMIFGYILRFILNGMPINPVFVANTLGVSEDHIRKVVDEFKFKDIYLNDSKEVKEETKEESKVELPDRNIWKVATDGNLEQLKVWLKSGINPDVKCHNWESTPLMYATQNGRLDCVHELLIYKADINVMNNTRKTALYYAIEQKHLDVINLLLTMKADPNVKDNKGYTCLMYAIQYSSMTNIVAELIKNGALVNIQNKYGSTPLHIAIYNGNLEGVKELLKHQLDINIKDNNGETPLFIASRCGYLKIVQVLIKSGANINLKNGEGVIPLVVASKFKHQDVVNELYEVYTQ